MVAEAMAVQLPSSKSRPVTTSKPKRRSFWRIPFLSYKRPAYEALKDVDSPNKKKGSLNPAASEVTDDVPLLEAGHPIKTKYQEKLSRHAASDDDEPFVPRPNTRIKFQLPNSTVTPTEETPPATKEPDTEPVTKPATGTASNVAVVDFPQEDDLISASQSGPSATADLGSADATVINDLVPNNSPMPAHGDLTLI